MKNPRWLWFFQDEACCPTWTVGTLGRLIRVLSRTFVPIFSLGLILSTLMSHCTGLFCLAALTVYLAVWIIYHAVLEGR